MKTQKTLALSLAIGASLSLGAFSASAQTLTFSSDFGGSSASSSTYSVAQANGAYFDGTNEIVGNGPGNRAHFDVAYGSSNTFQAYALTYDVGISFLPITGTPPGDGPAITYGTGNYQPNAYDVVPTGLTIQVPTYPANGSVDDALISWDGTRLASLNGIGAVTSGVATGDLIDFNTTISTSGLLSVNVTNTVTGFNQTFTNQLANWGYGGEDNSGWKYIIGNFSGGAGNTNQVSSEYINAVPEPSTYALFGLGALALVIAYRRRTA